MTFHEKKLKCIKANSCSALISDHRMIQLNETIDNFHFITSLDKYLPL